MDIEKLVETGARAICIEMGNNPDTDVGMIAGEGYALWECFTHEASSVLAIAFTAAAEEVDKKIAWYRQVIGNNPTNQVLAEKAQTAIDIAKDLRTLATQAEKTNG